MMANGEHRTAAVTNLFEITPHFGLRLQSFRYQSSVEYPDHTHANSSIVICTSGLLESVQFGTIVHLRAGEVLVTNRNTIHSSRYCVDGAPTEGVTIDLEDGAPERMFGMDREAIPVHLSTTRLIGAIASPKVHRLALDLRQELETKNAGREIVTECLAVQICVEVLRSWPRAMVRDHDGHLRHSMPRWRFIRAIEYIYSSLIPGSFDWNTMAETVGQTNLSDLKADFLQTTGLSVEDCRERIIVGHAKDLMANKRWSIAQTARVLGFDTPRQLTRLLRSSHQNRSLRSR